MSYYVGIDLGTSACKLLLVDAAGKVLNEVTKEYPLSFPRPGWLEQNLEDWWKAVMKEFNINIEQFLNGIDSVEQIDCFEQAAG